MSEMIDGKEYLTTGEAAKFLRVSPGWFKRRIVPENNLESFQKGVGREVYYEKAQLEPILKMRPRKEK